MDLPANPWGVEDRRFDSVLLMAAAVAVMKMYVTGASQYVLERILCKISCKRSIIEVWCLDEVAGSCYTQCASDWRMACCTLISGKQPEQTQGNQSIPGPIIQRLHDLSIKHRHNREI